MTTVSVCRRGGEVEEVGGTWHNFRKLQFCDGLEHWWPAAAASGSALPSLDKDTLLLQPSPGLAWLPGRGNQWLQVNTASLCLRGFTDLVCDNIAWWCRT